MMAMLAMLLAMSSNEFMRETVAGHVDGNDRHLVYDDRIAQHHNVVLESRYDGLSCIH
jgi:hypothetical protein